MKRSLILVVALAAALVLGACKRSEVTNVGRTLDNWANPNTAQSEAPTPVDVKEYHDANFSQDLGIEVVSLPDASTYTPNKFFVLDEWYGQIEFTTMDNLSLNVRLAKTGGRLLQGTYAESHIYNIENLEIDGIDVKIATSNESCALVSWERGDIQYVMHSNRKQGVPPRQAIEDMVNGLDSVVVDSSGTSG